MFNLLGAEGGSNVGTIIGLVVLLVLLVLYVGFGIVNRKKNQEQTMKMLNELKAGDKIVTYSGIYGEIVSMRETNMGRVLTIATGDKEKGKVSYIEINSSVIMGVDTKEDLVLDENGNVVEPEDQEKLKEEVLKETATEEKKEEKQEEVAKEEKKTTKTSKVKSTTAKKPAAKKTKKAE